ncbi:MAG TPA: ABC transporter ATP-binding protein [Acidimicrobiales bacterium]|jgi:ABC-2 type transport system ATP-binding protein
MRGDSEAAAIRTETAAIRTDGLGKRFGHLWALQDCSLSVPQGRVTALVGPNGAGKTTLLRLLVGLAAPTTGSATVLGRAPAQTEDYLSRIGYLAQDVPLYRRLSADDHLAMGAHLNARWDANAARQRLEALRIPTDRPVATLSGGQRAQVGLGLALAKRPQLLLLDEPVAALDPLARREFLGSLTEAVADGDLSVILSSHLLHDLERVCDHVILLAASRTQICSDIDDVLASHRMLVGPRRALSDVETGCDVIKATQTTNQTRLLVRCRGPVLDPAWDVTEVGLEDIILAYMGQEDPRTASPLTVMGAAT